MPGTRIYAFAKELGIKNEQLLDICNKLGIKGKGSALATLDDAEVEKIRKHLAEGEAQPEAKKKVDKEKEPPAPTRDDVVKRKKGPLIDLNVFRKKRPKPAEETETADQQSAVAAESSDSPVVEQKPEPAADPTAEPVVAASSDTTSTEKSESASGGAPIQDWVRSNQPGRSKIADMDRPRKKASKKIVKKRGGLNVKLAAMPEVKQPTAPAEPKEKVQKPEIALPKDGFTANKGGGPSEPLKFYTDKTKDKTKKRKGRPIDDEGEGGEGASDKRRRSKLKKIGGEDEFDSGLGSTRQMRSRRRKPGGDQRSPLRRRTMRRRSGAVANTAAPRKEKVVLELPCTVREFSEAAGVQAVQVLLTLRQLGDEAVRNINSPLDDESVELLLEHFGVDHVELRQAESLEEKLLQRFNEPDDPEKLQPRPPIVTFLGHVDHGKTSLLDAIIGIDVVSGESGGITQHIRAYQIEKNGNKVAFVDTPGHEAFTEMRARGANVTDIAVLVVAADDGVMPQTEEAISHAKAAGVPIIVALNKIDLPGVNPDKALQDLAQRDLLPSEWGGDIEVVRTSAIRGDGLDELLDTILVTAELHEYKANPDRPAQGTCLEAEQQADRGVVAKLMVQNGTLRVGDVVVCGATYGRVKAMHDTLNVRKKLQEAGPSTPVNLTGLEEPPEAGDKFYVLEDIAEARTIAEQRKEIAKRQQVGGRTVRTSLEEIQRRLEAGDLRDPNAEVFTLNLIIRADVRGSIEAIQKELSKISHPEIEIRVLQALPGGITVGDVRLAQASDAVIIGFNVVADEAARSLAEELNVEIRRYDIIYKVTDDLKAMLEGKLKPEEHVVEQGMAMVLQVFNISRAGAIAGCRVMRGTIQRDCRVRVIRDSRVIGDYPIESLKRVKDDVKEVQRGMECGIKLAGFNDIKEGDTLEAYRIEEVARTL